MSIGNGIMALCFLFKLQLSEDILYILTWTFSAIQILILYTRLQQLRHYYSVIIYNLMS